MSLNCKVALITLTFLVKTKSEFPEQKTKQKETALYFQIIYFNKKEIEKKK